MPKRYTGRQVARIGEELYARQLRAKVEQDNKGKFPVMDILTGDYEIDEEDVMASDRLLERHPDGVLYGLRIGYPAAYSIGGGFPIEQV